MAALSVAAAALSQPLSYAQRRQQINAGVLLIESQRIGGGGGQMYNPSPHHWGNLDRSMSVKPASWTFNNPVGSTTLSNAARLRWLANPAAGGVPSAGTRVTKSDAPFWEVALSDISGDQLTQFDVLSLTVERRMALNPLERERLRRFVDKGGVLWIDLSSNGSLVVEENNGAPYPFAVAPLGGSTEANLFHPVLSRPNSMTLDEVALMGGALGSPIETQFATLGGAGALSPILSTLGPDSAKLEAVVGTLSGRTVSVGRLGDGYVVVTSTGVTQGLGRGVLATAGSPVQPNRGYRSLAPAQDFTAVSAAKFAVNLVSLTTQYGSPGAGSRRSGSTATSVTAPLLQRFNDGLSSAVSSSRPPALFKGYLVVTDGQQVKVYDPKPSNDIDRDGNPDDGLNDPSGAGRDLIWTSGSLGGALSAPTVVESPDTTLIGPSGFRAVNQIWVSSSNGQVYVFDLESPGSVATPPIAGPISAPNGASQPDPNGPYSPTVHEGLVYVTDSRTTGMGRIWVCDLASGTRVESGGNAWAIFGAPRLQNVRTSAAVGYIPIADSSGGVDRIAYVGTSSSSSRPAGLSSIWIGAKGEAPSVVTRIGTNIRIQTRAALNGLPVFVSAGPSQLGVKLSLVKANGDPFTLAELSTNLTGAITATATNGEFNVELSGAGAGSAFDWDGTATPTSADNVGWRVDYTIDWSRAAGGTVSAQSFVRGQLGLPDDVSFSRQIVGAPAISRKGHVILATSTPGGGTPGGTVFNFKEEGRGEFDLVSRYDVFDQFDITLNRSQPSSTTIPYRETFIDEDDLISDLPMLNAPISGLTIQEPPSVLGDTVYVTAVGTKDLGFAGVPTSILFALKAHPESVRFEVDNLQINDRNQFSLVQPDYAKSIVKSNPDQESVLGRGRFSIERIPGTTRHRITIESLMANSRDRIRDAITTSAPIIIRGTQTGDTLIEPEDLAGGGSVLGGRAGGRFSHLLWYTVMNGYRSSTSPIVTGDTVYVAGSSVLPSLLVSGFTGLTFNAMIQAMDSQISGGHEFAKPNSVRAWQIQMLAVRKNSPSLFDFNPSTAIRWPQFKGVDSMDDLRVRVLQAAAPESEFASLAAGDGTVATTAPSRLYAFSHSDFLVADEGRISRFDAAGNPVWSVGSTLSAGPEQPASAITKSNRLSTPVRAYPEGTSSYWIVDSGANKVIQTDTAGRELRTVTGFRLHPQRVPSGHQAGESLDLNSPRDLLVFSTTHTAASVAATFPGETLGAAATDELWRHIVIADAGGFRAVELIDRYRIDAEGRVIGVVRYLDSTGGLVPAIGVLYWHSPEELTGKQFAYNSISRTYIDVGGTPTGIVAFGFGALEPGRGTFGLDSSSQQGSLASGNGGVVIYDGPRSLIINEYRMPGIQAGTYLGPVGGGFYGFNQPSLPDPPQTRKIIGLQSVTLREVSSPFGPRLGVMIADANGVFELIQQDPNDPVLKDRWIVNWMLTKEAFTGIRRPDGPGPFSAGSLDSNPSQFRPMYAQRLDSNDVLIVNGYVGATRGSSAYHGEVLMVEGSPGTSDSPGYSLGAPNLGFAPLSVKYELPPVQGIRGLRRPVFAIRQ
jgi:hypothetical protein